MRVGCTPKSTKELWESIDSEFETSANFPHCIGAVDGKHIRLTRPSSSGSMYLNYKDFYSVVLLAVANSRYRVVFVDIGSYGKYCDSSVFKKSNLRQSTDRNIQQLPDNKCLSGTQSPKVPHVFVGDEAFGLHKHLLRPFGGTHLPIEKIIFNYRLCRARRYVECGFGILRNKWRIFHRPINVQPDFAVDIVKACILLHNFVRDRDGFVIEDTTTITDLEDVPQETVVRGGLTPNNIINILCTYFVSALGIAHSSNHTPTYQPPSIITPEILLRLPFTWKYFACLRPKHGRAKGDSGMRATFIVASTHKAVNWQERKQTDYHVSAARDNVKVLDSLSLLDPLPPNGGCRTGEPSDTERCTLELTQRVPLAKRREMMNIFKDALRTYVNPVKALGDGTEMRIGNGKPWCDEPDLTEVTRRMNRMSVCVNVNRTERQECSVTKPFALGREVAGNVTGYGASPKTKSVHSRVHWAANCRRVSHQVVMLEGWSVMSPVTSPTPLLLGSTHASMLPLRHTSRSEYLQPVTRAMEDQVTIMTGGSCQVNGQCPCEEHNFAGRSSNTRRTEALRSNRSSLAFLTLSVCVSMTEDVLVKAVREKASTLEINLRKKRKRDWGKYGKDSAMVFVRVPPQSPGVISENHGKPKLGKPDRESRPGPPECESSVITNIFGMKRKLVSNYASIFLVTYKMLTSPSAVQSQWNILTGACDNKQDVSALTGENGAVPERNGVGNGRNPEETRGAAESSGIDLSWFSQLRFHAAQTPHLSVACNKHCTLLYNMQHYSPFTITSCFFEALLKYYFQGIPPPHAKQASKGTIHHIRVDDSLTTRFWEPVRVKRGGHWATPEYKSGASGISLRKAADKRRRLARLPRAQVRKQPRREWNSVRLSNEIAKDVQSLVENRSTGRRTDVCWTDATD
ncbi:hypothetical protein PR048_008696 [Dryococelus australis]|uniref:DDE Tnp4 domain-containing protein n=1 Tax=Dryococelus australis TaxID=614101 RepID=A0ABQ9HXW2_9NEOP|nr:hypothetical protein PR048_008696 [Dryococelus australis]